jgi:hypothetical protein
VNEIVSVLTENETGTVLVEIFAIQRTVHLELTTSFAASIRRASSPTSNFPEAGITCASIRACGPSLAADDLDDRRLVQFRTNSKRIRFELIRRSIDK